MTAKPGASGDAHVLPTTWLRWLAIGAALVSAALYVLIAVGVLHVGASTQEPTTDLLSFGALMGAIYLVIAFALWRFRARRWLVGIAAFQLIPLLGYVAAAGLREPPFETWGLLIKVAQAVVLVAASVLAWRAGHTAIAPARAHARGGLA
jgi:hypothetical protein